MATVRTGRATKSPAQLGQVRAKTPSVHCWQNVHSNVHIKASALSGGRSLSQHSQFGRSSNIGGIQLIRTCMHLKRRLPAPYNEGGGSLGMLGVNTVRARQGAETACEALAYSFKFPLRACTVNFTEDHSGF
jgi:hypothetical protein